VIIKITTSKSQIDGSTLYNVYTSAALLSEKAMHEMVDQLKESGLDHGVIQVMECADCEDEFDIELSECCLSLICPICIKDHASEGCDRMERREAACPYCCLTHGSPAPASCRAAHSAGI
jgi:hypothetical protein